MIISRELIEWIKENTGGLLKENEKEYQVFCPFCDDAYRKPSPRWGHLYISKDKPVFYCHRCNTKGHIIKLLDYLQYPEIDKIKKLYNYISPNYSDSNRIIIVQDDNSKDKLNSNNDYSIQHKIDIDWSLSFVMEYIGKRIGITDRLILDKHLNLKPARVSIRKDDNTYETYFGVIIYGQNIIDRSIKPLQARLINSKYRYIKLLNNKRYSYILPLSNHKNINIYNIDTLIISEGVFDTVNIYLYLKELNRCSSTLYTTVLGSSYHTKIFEFFVYYPNIKSIHLFVDRDIDIYQLIKAIIRHKKYLIQNDNFYRNIFNARDFNRVEINIYKNLISKDFGEYIKLKPILLKSIYI